MVSFFVQLAITRISAAAVMIFFMLIAVFNLFGKQHIESFLSLAECTQAQIK